MGAGEGEREGVGVGLGVRVTLGEGLGVGEPKSGQPSTTPLNRAAPLSTTYSTPEDPTAMPAGELKRALVPGPSMKALMPPTSTLCVVAPPEPPPAPVSTNTLPPARVTNTDRVALPPLPPPLTRVARPEGKGIPRAQVDRVPLGLAFRTAELKKSAMNTNIPTTARPLPLLILPIPKTPSTFPVKVPCPAAVVTVHWRRSGRETTKRRREVVVET